MLRRLCICHKEYRRRQMRFTKQTILMKKSKYFQIINGRGCSQVFSTRNFTLKRESAVVYRSLSSTLTIVSSCKLCFTSFLDLHACQSNPFPVFAHSFPINTSATSPFGGSFFCRESLPFSAFNLMQLNAWARDEQWMGYQRQNFFPMLTVQQLDVCKLPQYYSSDSFMLPSMN